MEPDQVPSVSRVARGRLARTVWFTGGWTSVAIGSVGVVVPGLPTTVFFIIAAGCFSRSSPRFEQWVLDLPKIGPLVRGYRAGDPMPTKAKAWAIGSIVVFAGASVVFFIDALAVRAIIAALAIVGIVVVSRA